MADLRIFDPHTGVRPDDIGGEPLPEEVVNRLGKFLNFPVPRHWREIDEAYFLEQVLAALAKRYGGFLSGYSFAKQCDLENDCESLFLQRAAEGDLPFCRWKLVSFIDRSKVKEMARMARLS